MLDGQLVGDEGGAQACAVVDDLQQVGAGGRVDGAGAPVVEHEDVGLGQLLQPAAEAVPPCRMRSSTAEHATRRYSTEWPWRQAYWASAQANQVLPRPVAPAKVTQPGCLGLHGQPRDPDRPRRSHQHKRHRVLAQGGLRKGRSAEQGRRRQQRAAGQSGM